MKTIKFLIINTILSVLFITSCKNRVENKPKNSSKIINTQREEPKKEVQKKLNFDNSKFYLLSKNNSQGYYLKKFYFEGEMEIYKFIKNEFIDKTGSSIMEPLEYLIQEINDDKDDVLDLKVKRKMTDKVETIQFKYISSKGLLHQIENKKIIKTFIDSLYISSINSIYIPPCKEYQTDKYEIKDCLEEYVKTEELKRVKNNDFNWYPRLDCKKYFEDSFCKELNSY